MLKFGNKEFRNLQEQVLKNMRDIQNVMQGATVLAEFGIKVIGQVDTAADLPNPATYEGEFGDAYIVGTEEPYKYYIFTRAFEGQDTPSWFDLGIFPVPGPQGPKGDTGDTGPQGQTGNPGTDGLSAGFGSVTASATTLEPGSEATVSVTTSGPNTEKSFVFTFGIPEGEPGVAPVYEWGNITGDISDQTDLITVLQGKQNTLVSGTNIKTINGSSILGSGNLSIQSSVALEYGDTTFDAPDILAKAKSGCPIYVQIDNEEGELQVFHLHTVVVNSDESQIQMFFINEFTNAAQTAAYMSQVKVLYSSGTITWTEPETLSLGGSTGVAWGSITGTLSNQTDLQQALNRKQATISDLSTIRSGAAAGATAVQPEELATVATTGSYNDLSNKPTIPTYTGSGNITISSSHVINTVIDPTFTNITVDNDTSGLYVNSLGDTGLQYVDSANSADIRIIQGVPELQNTSEDYQAYLRVGTQGIDITKKDFINDTTVTKDLFTVAGLAESAVQPAAIANMVTTDTYQDILGTKNFTSDAGIRFKSISISSNSPSLYIDDNIYKIASIIRPNNISYIPNTDDLTTIHTISLPLKTGTVALTSDIPSLTNYVTTNTAQTISGAKTFSTDVSADALIKLNGTSDYWSLETDNTYNQLRVAHGNTRKLTINDSAIFPNPTSSIDLGGSSYKFKDLYLSGSTYLGNTDHYIRKGTGNVVEIGANGSTILTLGSSSTAINSVFRANGDNVKDLGQPTVRWKDLYIAGSLKDGTNSLSVADIQPKLTAGTGIAISNNVISSTLEGIDYEVDSQLPASGQKGIIYLVPNGSSGSENIYNEYIWIPAETSGSTGRFEFIGTTQTDLTNYVTTNTYQAITGAKTMRSQLSIDMTEGNGALNLVGDLSNNAYPFILFSDDGNYQITFGSGSAITADRDISLPDASGTLALTSDIPTVPTTVSSFTNDAGYITGITSGMVTTALGYTPVQSVTPTSETWTFTLADGTTTTKTIVTAVTSA